MAKKTQQMAKPKSVYHRWQDPTDGKKDPTDGMAQQMAKPISVYHRWQDPTDGKIDPTDGKEDPADGKTQQMAKPNSVYHRWQNLTASTTDDKKDPSIVSRVKTLMRGAGKAANKGCVCCCGCCACEGVDVPHFLG
jgi:hypothetical protein